MKNRHIGTIEPLLKIRIDNIQHQINYIIDTYMPGPPVNLRQDVYDNLQALFAQKEMLANKI
jgi:hypothetical protein